MHLKVFMILGAFCFLLPYFFKLFSWHRLFCHLPIKCPTNLLFKYQTFFNQYPPPLYFSLHFPITAKLALLPIWCLLFFWRERMGALDYLSNFCTITSTRGKKKPMQVCMHIYIWLAQSWLLLFYCFTSWRRVSFSQTVEIKVKMDCDGCERRVKNAVKNIKGIYYHILHEWSVLTLLKHKLLQH